LAVDDLETTPAFSESSLKGQKESPCHLLLLRRPFFPEIMQADFEL
jgi:hypothetical protein